MMSHSDFDTFLRETMNGVTFKEAILPKIKETSVRALASVVDKLERVGKGFEWLGLIFYDLLHIYNRYLINTSYGPVGLDFMVSDSLDVLMLEVNVSPDISKSTPITSRLVSCAATDLFRLLLDEGAMRDEEPAADADPMWTLWSCGEVKSKPELIQLGY